MCREDRSQDANKCREAALKTVIYVAKSNGTFCEKNPMIFV